MGKNSVKFGGLDVALRSDNTSLFVMKLENGIFEEIGLRIWPHVHPAEIMNDLIKIQKHELMFKIGYDRLGTGELVKMFPRELPMYPVISSQPGKLDIIGLINALFTSKKLIIHSDDLYKEILEQEKYVSDAGNVLYRHPSGFHDDRFWSMGMAVKVASDYLKGMVRVRAGVINPDITEEGIITEDMLNNI